MRIESKLPVVVGQCDVNLGEYMLMQYLPVKMLWPCPDVLMFPASISHHLFGIRKLVDMAMRCESAIRGDLSCYYVYLTVKNNVVVAGGNVNRPGWHIDGYGSDDSNYIWHSSVPTLFLEQAFDLSEDHNESMQQMEQQANNLEAYAFPNGTLLRLDNNCVHKIDVPTDTHVRTFIKVSFSKNRYNLKGNAHNYLFDYNWEMKDRAPERNHPTK